MSFPASLTTRTVKGRFVTHPDGKPASGFVRIVLDGFMQGPTDDTFVVPFDRVFRLINGEFSTMLPATNDPQWSGSFYRVYITVDTKDHYDRYRDPAESINTSKHRLEVPYDSTAPMDLADYLNVPAGAPGSIYIISSQRGVPGGIATLGSDGKITPSQLPASSGGAVEWDDILDKPATFPHDEVTWDEVTGKPDINPGGDPEWDDILDKPATFPPSTHTHTESDVTGLTADLAAKASTTALTSGLAGKANTSHTHVESDITGLSADLAAKADASTVTTSLASKADLVGGVVPTSQIPSISKIDFLGSVSTQSAMLALTGQSGDWCIRTDLGQTWVITGSNPTQLSSWTSMPIGTSPVQTVNGQTGTVVLGKSDVGLGSVDNTADTAKPVSTAQQTALDLKAPLASPTFTGTVSGVTAAMVGLGNANNTADTAKPVSTAQQTALDLKAPLASPTFTGTVGGITKAMVALGNVDNTADTAKPVSTAQQTALDAKAPLASPTFTGTVSGITKTMVGLGSVDNTADTAKPVSTAQQTALDAKADASAMTTALDAKAPLASPTFTGTVAGITKSMVGLSNVDNTTDVGKPVSTAQQTALDLKAPLASPTFTGTVGGVTKSMVGLSSVDNTADTAKPVSTAQQTALDLKAPLASPTFTGTPAAPTPTAGDSTTKIATTAFVTAVDVLKAPLASPTFTGTPAAPTAAAGTNTTQVATTAFVLANQGFLVLSAAASVPGGTPTGTLIFRTAT